MRQIVNRAIPFLILILIFGCSALGEPLNPSRSSENAVVVPAGTKLVVQLDYGKRNGGDTLEGKFVWPVQVGFSTAIPVGAKVRAHVSVRWTYDAEGNPQAFEVVELTTVLVNDKAYDLATDVLLLETGTVETKFTSLAELQIER